MSNFVLSFNDDEVFVIVEHLKDCLILCIGDVIYLCFTSFLFMDFCQSQCCQLTVVLVPVIKDKAGKISSKDNYRPVALASVFSKVIEVIILGRIEICLDTNPNQFGFKKKHGTDQCIYIICVKENYRFISNSEWQCIGMFS